MLPNGIFKKNMHLKMHFKTKSVCDNGYNSINIGGSWPSFTDQIHKSMCYMLMLHGHCSPEQGETDQCEMFEVHHAGITWFLNGHKIWNHNYLLSGYTLPLCIPFVVYSFSFFQIFISLGMDDKRNVWRLVLCWYMLLLHGHCSPEQGETDQCELFEVHRAGIA